MNPLPTALYRYVAQDDGRVLYIGTTSDLDAMQERHRNESPWWSFAKLTDVGWYPSQESAEAAKRVALRAHDPLFNSIARNDGTAKRQTRNVWLAANIRDLWSRA